MVSLVTGKLTLLTKSLADTCFTISRGVKVRFGPIFPEAPLVLRPEKLDVGMSGGTYQTKIVRKRQVKDINLPVFTQPPVESLKWADWRMLRDVRRRHIYSYHHQLKRSLTCIMRNNILPTTIKELAFSEVNKIPKPGRYTKQLTWRCGITSRARGRWLKFKIGRIAFRGLADHNFISGAKRACWGP